MADTKTTGLTEHIGPPVDNDMLYMADVSDTTMAASGTSKKNQAKNYLRTNGTANTLGANLAANGYNFTGAGTVSTAAMLAANYYGSTVSGGTVVISSTTHATKGKILFGAASAFDEVNNRLGIGTIWPTAALFVSSPAGGTAVLVQSPTVGGASDVLAMFKWANDNNWILRLEQQHVNGSHLQWNWIEKNGVSSYNVLTFKGGNVGINNTSPGYKLDVGGSFQCTQAGGSWASVSFGSGWENYGGDYQVAQYKKVGDLVFLRGLVKRTSGTGTLITTLPSGYRPPARCLYIIDGGGGYGRVDILSNGEVSLSTTVTVNYIQLDGLFFSTV